MRVEIKYIKNVYYVCFYHGADLSKTRQFETLGEAMREVHDWLRQ